MSQAFLLQIISIRRCNSMLKLISQQPTLPFSLSTLFMMSWLKVLVFLVSPIHVRGTRQKVTDRFEEITLCSRKWVEWNRDQSHTLLKKGKIQAIKLRLFAFLGNAIATVSVVLATDSEKPYTCSNVQLSALIAKQYNSSKKKNITVSAKTQALNLHYSLHNYSKQVSPHLFI